MSTQRFAGIDIGTTSVKGVVIDGGGRVLRAAHRALGSGQAGTDLDADVVVATVEAVASLLWPFDALAIAGMVNTHLLVDDRGRPLTPAMTWNNQLASGYARDGWTATSAVTRVRRWKAEYPEVMTQARWVMLPKDYVTLRLCGKPLTDSTSWPDLIDHGRLAQRVPAEIRLLIPPMVQPEEVIGEYRGVPLLAGCMDSLAAVLGSGPTPAGTGIDVGGTSETVGVVAGLASHAATVRGTLRLPDGWWHAGPTQAGGRSLCWGAGILTGSDLQDFVSLAALAPRSPTGIIFLPYLEGERAPLWDPRAEAAFAGLSSACTRADIARSVLEGVAFSVRHILSAAAPADCPADRLVICGRPSAIGLWNQIKADVTGLTCFVPDQPDTGPRGAAMLAYAGTAGLSLGMARAALAPGGHIVEPEPRNAELYAELFARYVALWPAIRETALGARSSSVDRVGMVEDR